MRSKSDIKCESQIEFIGNVRQQFQNMSFTKGRVVITAREIYHHDCKQSFSVRETGGAELIPTWVKLLGITVLVDSLFSHINNRENWNSV